MRNLVRRIVLQSMARVAPQRLDLGLIPAEINGRTFVVAAGKAAAGMMRRFAFLNSGNFDGVVVLPHGFPAEEMPPGVAVRYASHPIPDASSVTAAEFILREADQLGASDQLVALLSGGASALLCSPLGLELEEKCEVIRCLISSGATIEEINCVRKHLSRIKGGRLALAAAPARVTSLVLSDVVGDDISVIASGPTAPDPSSSAEADAVLDRWKIRLPRVSAAFQNQRSETPKPDGSFPARVVNRIVGGGEIALRAMAVDLEQNGYRVKSNNAAVVGNAVEVALTNAAAARRLLDREAIVSGGEVTVRVTGKGRGGPNLEYLLALALELNGTEEIFAASVDSDGMDGGTDAAGAIITPDTLQRARSAGLDPSAMLEENDAHSFFSGLGDLICTGPSGTNVNDLRLILRCSGQR